MEWLSIVTDPTIQWRMILDFWPYSETLLFALGSSFVHSITFWGINAMFYFLHITGYD